MTANVLVEELNRELILPAFVAPMFLISGPELVVAAGKAGLMGCYPGPNARTIEDLDAHLSYIDQSLTSAGRESLWVMNMIVHPSYDRFEQELDLVRKYKPKIVISALGSPTRVIEPVHAYGGKVFADVIGVEHAKKAVDSGADGLILVCAGAGGHTGQYSPMAFVEEVRQFWDGPLIVGGAISNAKAINAVLSLGADFAYMGTRFISCPETMVTDEYREMLIRAQMQEIIATAAITGVKGNWMLESLQNAGFDVSNLNENKKVDFSDIQSDSKAWKNVWGAGQAVGTTQSIETVEEIVNELKSQWLALDKQQRQTLTYWSGKLR